jgi:PAS domain S-box-containing protein
MGHPRRTLLAVCLLLAVVSVAGCDLHRQSPPRASKGVLDLRGWDFTRDGPVELAGEFEFNWGRHIDPGQIDRAARGAAFVTLPGYWNGQRVDGETLSGEGFATYRLTVLVAPSRIPLALQVREVSTAYRLFVDGELLAAAGEVGTTAETSVPEYLPQVAGFRLASGRIDILLQVSNFHHRRGGPWDVVTLGAERDILKLHERMRLFDFFLLGGIFIMTLYHLMLFLSRRQYRATLLYGIFCLLVALRLLTTDARYLLHMLGTIDWSILVRLQYLSFYLAVPVFFLFLRLIFPEFPERLVRTVVVLCGLFSAVVVFTPVRIFSHTLTPFEVATLGLIAYVVWKIASLAAQHRVEATVFLLGLIVLCLTVVNDMLYVERIIRTGFYTPFGLLFFIVSQAFLTSFRLLKAFTVVEERSLELRDTLESLKQEVLDRIRIEAALRESEEKYRTILNSIQEGYYEADLSGNLTFFNDSLCGILGYPREAMLGMNNRQYMTPEAARRVYDTFTRVFNTGEPAKAFDWEVIASDGSRKTVEASVTLMRGARGAPIGFRGVVRDITERRRAEEQAKLHQQQLMQAGKMAALGVLVSGMAHEINNPNNFIMLNAPILRAAWESALPILDEYHRENGDFLMGGMRFSELREQMPKLLAGVSQGAERIKQIVANLKHYVRGDTGGPDQLVDVNAVITSAVSLISNVIKNATDHFTVDLAKDLPPVRGSSQRLEQVILNLIQNACQALPDKTRGLFIATETEAGGAGVRVAIRDEGAGIRAADLPRVREPFFTTKADSGGIGLGLSISSRIVEEHRGSMQFSSEPGSGTTVTLHLPSAARPEVAARPASDVDERSVP